MFLFRSIVVTTLLATLLLTARPTLGQQFIETDYGKRVLAFRQLEREILDKRIEAEGMLRVAGELQRKKPRPRAEAQMIVPRYDDFTKTLVDARRQDAQIMKAIATINSSTDVTPLRQKLEIEKRSMELRFKKQQSANTQLRKGSRQRGTKAKNNRRLQSVIDQQKQAKQAYDAALYVIAEQLRALRGIESSRASGGEGDTTGCLLHRTMTNFEFVVMPQREKGRVWVEKQAEYALLNSTEQRVVKRDDYRKKAEAIKREVDQLNDKVASLVGGAAAGDDLQQLANLLQKQAVDPTATKIELKAARTDKGSYFTSPHVLSQKMTLSGNAGDMEFTATLSPSLTLEEIHSPEWALKFKDKYPFVHSGGVLWLWVGQFHIAITPSNDAARRASPGNGPAMLKWIDGTLKLDDLAAL